MTRRKMERRIFFSSPWRAAGLKIFASPELATKITTIFFSSPNVAPVQTGARFFFVAVFRGSFRRLRGAVPSPTSFGLERLPESNAGPPVSSMKKAPKRLQNRPGRAFRDT